MHAHITVLPGDGISPEITQQTVRVLCEIGQRCQHTFTFTEAHIGGAAIDATGDPLPEATLDQCRHSDAILLGAVGGPRWESIPARSRPEQGLLRLRKALGLFANLRPVSINPSLIDRSPLRAELLDGVDMIIVRELTGGIYFGDKAEGDERASDECTYTVSEIERIAHCACKLASQRSGRLTSIDKANVLATSRLWRRTVERIVRDEYPHIELEHLLVDAAAMHLIQQPARFDVIVTENMFGDILSDEASVLAGSLGMLPSASIAAHDDDSVHHPGVFEPIHGSAPDLTGRNVANPYGAILSAAMLLRHGLRLEHEAATVERAVDKAIRNGALTQDIVATDQPACTTDDVGRAVVDAMRSTQLLEPANATSAAAIK